jgi:uncharacterized protein YdhG (YjbR/CyaY superfamily)
MAMNKASDIDAYINGFDKNIQKLLQQLRATIRQAAPAAEEAMKYGIPTFTLNGNLIHFGAYKNHIGLYPAPSGIKAFKKELSSYEGSKGTIRFPLDKPLPFDLVSKIVKFRVEESLKKAEAKSKKNVKTCPLGHKFTKSSNCPTCPVCEQGRKLQDGFLSLLSAPARRALEKNGITTLQQLSRVSEKEVLLLHGMGPASLPKLRSALQNSGLSFRKEIPKN